MTMHSRLFLLCSFLMALLIGLGDRPVFKIQEVRVAETAREMLVSGDWLIPRYNGDLRLQKPPLPYWLTSITFNVGGVSAYTTRLPSVLFGLVTALLIWLKVRREYCLKTASNCAIVLITSYIGLRYFRSGESDAVLLFFITAACISGFDIIRGQYDALKCLLFWLALGLGFLSKGPAAFAIPILALFAFTLFKGEGVGSRTSVGNLFSIPGILLMFVVAFGWYAWILWKFPNIAQQFLTHQVDETFVSGTHPKPVWWYFAHLFEFFAPWGFLIVPAAWLSYKNRRQVHNQPLIIFSWIWLAIVFALLTATVNKQMQYALLLLPPVSIILGHYLTYAQDSFLKANRVMFLLFIIAALGGVYMVFQYSPDAITALVWIGCPTILILINQYFCRENISTPVFLVASVTATAFIFSETYINKEPSYLAAKSIIIEASKYSPLYQPRTALNDGSISFYAGYVVRPLEDTEIIGLLKLHREIWMVGERVPELANVTSSVLAQSGELKLFKLYPVSRN